MSFLRIAMMAILFAAASIGSASAEQASADADQVADVDAKQLVREAWDYFRGQSSSAEMTMTIHRVDWERTMSMQSYTKGEKKSLVRVVAPKKDKGNGTLMNDKNMWSYSPKVNRVIKVPSSMMGQSWMGSDFSNKDVSRADDIVDSYTHTLLDTRQEEGLTIYTVQSVPLEDAAVVWGREVIEVREDYLMLSHRFYDQDDALVKEQNTLEIKEMGGRLTATKQRMHKVDSPDEWTEIVVSDVAYDADLDDSLFTLSNLRNPRD